MYLICFTIFRGPPFLCSKSSSDASEKSVHSKLASEERTRTDETIFILKLISKYQSEADVNLLTIVPSLSGSDATETLSQSATCPVWRPHQPCQNTCPTMCSYEVRGPGSHPGPGTVTYALGDANSLMLWSRVEAAVSHDTSPSVADLLLLQQRYLNVYLFTACSLRRSHRLLENVIGSEVIQCYCWISCYRVRSCSQALACCCVLVTATCPCSRSGLLLLPTSVCALARAALSHNEIPDVDNIRDKHICKAHVQISLVSDYVDGLIMTDHCLTDHRLCIDTIPIHTGLILHRLAQINTCLHALHDITK